MITPIIPTTVPPTSAIPKVPPIPNRIIPNIFIFIHLSFCNMLIKGLQPGDCRRSFCRRNMQICSSFFFCIKMNSLSQLLHFCHREIFCLYHFIPSEDFYFHFSYRNFHTERNLFLPKEVCVIRNYVYISPLIRLDDVYM